MGIIEERLYGILDFTKTEKIGEVARKSREKAFTRKRKMPLYDIIVSILIRKGLTSSMEIRNFFKQKNDIEGKITKQAWLKARRQLNPEVFEVLNDEYLRYFYSSEEEVKTWNNYLVFAIDGSKVEITNSKENREKYGTFKTKNGESAARALASGMFDVLNNFFIDLRITNLKESEISAARKNIKAIKRIGFKQKILVIFDRGYPSLELFNYLEENGISYIIRLPKSDYTIERKQLEEEENDCEIELTHTYRRLLNVKNKDIKRYEELKAKGSTKVRFVREKTPSGEEFALFTNLPKTISGEEICKSYFLRWKIEEAYQTLKNKMKFESVSGNASIYVKQDFLSQIFVYNMMEDIRMDAEKQIQQNPEKYKHPQAINQNEAIGIFKDEMIDLWLEEDSEIRALRFKALQDELKKCLRPVRKSPSKPRKFNIKNRFFSNQKPPF